MSTAVFVDDDVRVVDGLRRALRRVPGWDFTFVTSGAAALDAIRSGGVDAVVTDIRMPGMDGADLLTLVRAEFPSVVRIVLSGQSGERSSLALASLAHQVLAKPCEPAAIIAALESAIADGSRIHSAAARAAVGEIGALPACPETVLALTDALDDPGASAAQIAAIVGRDPALAAKVLQLVNSSFFAIGRPVSDVAGAVTYLGLSALRVLVVSTHAFQAFPVGLAFPGWSAESLRDDALGVATLARAIAGPELAADAFTVALLRDIGQLIIASRMPRRFSELLAGAAETSRPLHQVELERDGYTHADVGAYLLGMWGLPAPIVTAVASHHDTTWLETAELTIADVLAVADHLSNAPPGDDALEWLSRQPALASRTRSALAARCADHGRHQGARA